MSGATVVVEQRVAAEPERVYAAFTSAEELARWWWPHIADTTHTVDARVGGAYDIRSVSAGIGARGEFLELDPPRLIRMTWNWMNDGVSTVEEQVELAFNEDAGAGCGRHAAGNDAPPLAAGRRRGRPAPGLERCARPPGNPVCLNLT